MSIVKYLKEKILYLVLYLLIFAVLVGSFLLYELPVEAVAYPMGLGLLLFIAFITVDYRSERKKFKRVRELEQQIAELKQRAAVARALITSPRIVLADEPTGALDSRSTDELLSLFSDINDKGQTILMVTHSVKAASHAKRVLFIKDGVVFHQLYRGDESSEDLYQKISDTLTMLARGGE